MNILQMMDQFLFVFYWIAMLFISVVIYTLYYKRKFKEFDICKKLKWLNILLCYIEELMFMYFVIPSTVFIHLLINTGYEITFTALSNNHKDLLIASLTVYSITIATALICINFERKIVSTLARNQTSLNQYEQDRIIVIINKIKLFSSGYKHLWISGVLIGYTLWLLLQLANNDLLYPEIHYSIWCKCTVIYGISIFKTILEYSVLSHEV